MLFTLLGGDARMVILCRRLRADGHTVIPFAMEQALPDCAGTAPEALAGAECVLLPLPCERDGVLNAPFSALRCPLGALLEAVRPGTILCAGAPGEALRRRCEERGLDLRDYAAGERFALRNARLTAEGALALLRNALPRPLEGSAVLVVGYGRIGRILAELLAAQGARVTVAARNPLARAEAEAHGCAALPPEAAAAPGFDAVVNTVPAILYREAELTGFGPALLLELASPPYGFDPAAARALGKEILFAPGLPGKTAPESAAEAIQEGIYAALSIP